MLQQLDKRHHFDNHIKVEKMRHAGRLNGEGKRRRSMPLSPGIPCFFFEDLRNPSKLSTTAKPSSRPPLSQQNSILRIAPYPPPSLFSMASDITMIDADDPLSLSASDASGYSSITELPPLLRLPPELRQRIFSLCLINEHPISWPSPKQSATGLDLALLRTCKTIHEQAARILYERNVLLFRHPSDCNMFLYMHNQRSAQSIRTLLLHVTDREVSMWTQYLSSTLLSRSLMHDYPNLEDLYIVLKSSIFLGSPHHDLVQAYRKWQHSKALINLCASLSSQREVFRVRVLFVRFASKPDTDGLLQHCPEEFNKMPDTTPGPRLRTFWRSLYGCEVALDATLDGNPWTTGHLF
jgi:hypothetical protein